MQSNGEEAPKNRVEKRKEAKSLRGHKERSRKWNIQKAHDLQVHKRAIGIRKRHEANHARALVRKAAKKVNAKI